MSLFKITMGFFAKLLKAIPTSANLQFQIRTLEAENADLKKQLEDCRRFAQALQEKNKKLTELLAEDVFFHKGTEFRKGRTTANQWQAFCPVCHLPVKSVAGYERLGLVCCNAPKCEWKSPFSAFDLEKIISEVVTMKNLQAATH